MFSCGGHRRSCPRSRLPRKVVDELQQQTEAACERTGEARCCARTGRAVDAADDGARAARVMGVRRPPSGEGGRDPLRLGARPRTPPRPGQPWTLRQIATRNLGNTFVFPSDSCGARLDPRPSWPGRIFLDRPLEQQDEHNGDDEQQDRDDRGLATAALPGRSGSRALDRRLISGRGRCHGDHPVARVEWCPPASVL